MTRRGSGRSIWLGVAVLVAISLALAWLLDYAADVSSHLTVVRHYARTWRWMTPEQWELGPERGHGYHLFSPVPYAPYVPFEFLQQHVGWLHGGERGRFVVRLGGVAILVAQLAATIAIVRRMCPACSRSEGVLVAVASNLVPQLRYLHAYPNADAVTILAGTLAFAVALRVLQRSALTLRDAILVGGTLGLAAHGRYTVFVVAGLLLTLFVGRVVLGRLGPRTTYRFVGTAVAIPLLVAAPMHLHVYNELDNGHLLATVDNEQLALSTFEGDVRDVSMTAEFVRSRVRLVPTVWQSTWLSFEDYAELRGAWLGVLLGGVLAGVVGCFVRRSTIFARHGRVIAICAVAAVGITWAVGMFQRVSLLPGRFLLAAGVTALTGVILGNAVLVERLTGVRRPVLVSATAWAVFLAGLNVWGIARVAAA